MDKNAINEYSFLEFMTGTMLDWARRNIGIKPDETELIRLASSAAAHSSVRLTEFKKTPAGRRIFAGIKAASQTQGQANGSGNGKTTNGSGRRSRINIDMNEVMQMIDRGDTHAKIAEKYKISQATLYNRLKAHRDSLNGQNARSG